MRSLLIVSSLVGIAASTTLGQTVSFTIAGDQVGRIVFSAVEEPRFEQVVQIVFVSTDGMGGEWSNDGMTSNYLVLSTVLHLGELGNSFSIPEVSQLSGVDPAYVQITLSRDRRFLIPLPENRFAFNSDFIGELQSKVMLLRNTLHLPPLDWSSDPPPLRIDDSPDRRPAGAVGSLATPYATTALYGFGIPSDRRSVGTQSFLRGTLSVGISDRLRLVLSSSGRLTNRTVLVPLAVFGITSQESITLDARLHRSTSDWDWLAFGNSATVANQLGLRTLLATRNSDTIVSQYHVALWDRSSSEWDTSIRLRAAELVAPELFCSVGTCDQGWPGQSSRDRLRSSGVGPSNSSDHRQPTASFWDDISRQTGAGASIVELPSSRLIAPRLFCSVGTCDQVALVNPLVTDCVRLMGPFPGPGIRRRPMPVLGIASVDNRCDASSNSTGLARANMLI